MLSLLSPALAPEVVQRCADVMSWESKRRQEGLRSARVSQTCLLHPLPSSKRCSKNLFNQLWHTSCAMLRAQNRCKRD